MRFSTILAFTLPLAALAVSTPSPVLSAHLQAQLQLLNDARAQFTIGLNVTSTAVNQTIVLAAESNQSALLKQAVNANEKIFLAFQAAVTIDADVQNNILPSDEDQRVVTKNILEAQSIINSFEIKISNKCKCNCYRNSSEFSDAALEQLPTAISDAAKGVNETVDAGLEVLRLQGKDVRQLFEDANQPVPPGF